MFDFQKEVIINSNTLEDGVTKRYMATEGTVKLFRVLRCADYRKEGLVDGVIYKTASQPGQNASVIFKVPSEAGLYRVIVAFSLDERYLSDYAYPWSKFGKPLMAEFEITEAIKSDGAKKQAVMMNALMDAIPENNKFAIVAKENQGNNDKIKISGVDYHQSIKMAEVQKVEQVACPADACHEWEYNTIEVPTITPNKLAIGTADWLQENLRFPSYPNLRYNALNEEEYPVKGATYTQYSFQYSSVRKGLHGQGTVGQVLNSVTTHTFYVISTEESGFETDLKKVFGDNAIKEVTSGVSTNYSITILNDAQLTKKDLEDDGVQIEATMSGPAINGNVTVTFNKDSEATTDGAVYELTSGGLLTVDTDGGKSATVGDEIVISASYGTSAKTVKKFIVIA